MSLSEDLRAMLSLRIQRRGLEEVEMETRVERTILLGFVEERTDLPLRVADELAGYLGCRLSRPNLRWQREWQDRREKSPSSPAQQTGGRPAIIRFPGLAE
jgi:hypothetical protein